MIEQSVVDPDLSIDSMTDRYPMKGAFNFFLRIIGPAPGIRIIGTVYFLNDTCSLIFPVRLTFNNKSSF
jgi:hypothetical protein